MNVLSLFDGMSCGQIALDKLGIKVDNYFASEIKPHAIKVAQANYPNTVQLGDIKNIGIAKPFIDKWIYNKTTGEKLHNIGDGIDLFIGGSPCQDFSQANRKRDGLQGVKSGLFYEYVRLLKETKPKYFLLENVKMKKEYQDIISGILGVQPISINSKLVSAGMRNRLYWTNIPNITQPPDMNINGRDVFEDTSYEIAIVRKGKNGG